MIWGIKGLKIGKRWSKKAAKRGRKKAENLIMVDINYIIHGIFFILIKWVKKITISDVVMVIALVMMSIGLGVKMKEVDKNKEITIEKRQE